MYESPNLVAALDRYIIDAHNTRRDRQAEEQAHYRAEFAAENGLADYPREVADKVWDLAWEHGHASGYTEVGYHYADFAQVAVAAYEAGKAAAGA